MSLGYKLSQFSNQILNIGVDSAMEFEEKRSIRTLNAVGVLAFPFPAILSAILCKVVNENLVVLLLGFSTSAIFALLPIFSHYRKRREAVVLLYVALFVNIIVDHQLLNGVPGLDVGACFLLVGAYSFSTSTKEIYLYSILAAITIFASITFFYSSQKTFDWSSFGVHASFATASIIFSYISLRMIRLQTKMYEVAIEQKNTILEDQREELLLQHENLSKLNLSISEKNEKLGHKNFMLTESLNYARRIQMSTLPSAKDLLQLVGEACVFFRPKDIVSGDFYWISKRKDHIFFAIADCTGHGVPGAFMSLMGVNLLNQIISEQEERTPAQILQRLNKKLNDQLSPESTDEYAHEGLDIILCAISESTGTLSFSSIGRPVLLYRDGHVIEFKGTRTFASKNIHSSGGAVKEELLKLRHGDTLYFLTDGFTDQFDITNRSKYGMNRLKKFLPQIASIDLASQLELLRMEFDSWKGHTAQTDDVLLLVYRFTQKLNSQSL